MGLLLGAQALTRTKMTEGPSESLSFGYTGLMVPGRPFDRITVEPEKCGGKPCIRGMRITVRRILELLAFYWDRAEILREYPFLEEEDLQQALQYAAAAVDEELIDLSRVA
ncbi:MAG TPA: DUF433 domain-containing protein [Bryobacteraceae bacterium]